MIERLRKLNKTLINVVILFYTFARVLFHYLRSKAKREYEPFDDKEKDSRVLIVGNGPSISNLNLNKYQKRDFIIAVVNFFPSRNDSFFEIKPEYLCLFDPTFFSSCPNGSLDKDLKDLYDCLSKVDWDMKIIAPSGKKLQIKNHNISYIWVNDCVIDNMFANKVVFKLFSRNLACFGYQNVILGGLYYFITSKFKRIYLAGVDMSDFKNIYVDEKNRIYTDSTHSYGVTRQYLDKNDNSDLNRFSQLLGAYQKMFHQFDIARKYADYKGIDVVNLSMNSYIDSFEKKEPTEIAI